jgi:hypothetical protein
MTTPSRSTAITAAVAFVASAAIAFPLETAASSANSAAPATAPEPAASVSPQEPSFEAALIAAQGDPWEFGQDVAAAAEAERVAASDDGVVLGGLPRVLDEPRDPGADTSDAPSMPAPERTEAREPVADVCAADALPEDCPDGIRGTVLALRALPELEAAASPTAFLLRAATNHCLNVLRASRAAWRDEVARLAGARRERGIEPDARELVRALLGVASPESQEIAVLYFVDELTQAEIAAETGRSLPTIRKRLREFLAAARGALAEAFPGITLPGPEELP